MLHLLVWDFGPCLCPAVWIWGRDLYDIFVTEGPASCIYVADVSAISLVPHLCCVPLVRFNCRKSDLQILSSAPLVFWAYLVQEKIIVILLSTFFFFKNYSNFLTKWNYFAVRK